jgi:hypothetical protein
LVTQAEIEAAVDAYRIVGIGENVKAGLLAILEAAERVWPRRDPTYVLRHRRYKAKRRNVTTVLRPETGNVTRLTPGSVTSPAT